MGLPVVVSRTKTIQYYFTDDMVFFFNPEDIQDFAEKVFSIYNNRSQARASVQIARAYIDKIGWKKEKKKYINLITSFTAKY
jgi:glycosyltransferase involved in cell wall biosynthesis